MRTFGIKREEVTGEWRLQCNGKLYDLYSIRNIIRDEGQVGEMRNANNSLIGKT
jgi:hypothetical protein